MCVCDLGLHPIYAPCTLSLACSLGYGGRYLPFGPKIMTRISNPEVVNLACLLVLLGPEPPQESEREPWRAWRAWRRLREGWEDQGLDQAETDEKMLSCSPSPAPCSSVSCTTTTHIGENLTHRPAGRDRGAKHFCTLEKKGFALLGGHLVLGCWGRAPPAGPRRQSR